MDSFRELLQQKGEESLQVCLSTWAGQIGFESVYGGMFEHFCHRKLQSNTGMLRLRMRIVYKESKDNNENIYTVVLPKFHKDTCRYTSNNPSFLGEAHVEGVDEFKYFWPTSSNHPTYDSAVVVSSESLGLGDVNINTKEPGLDKLKAAQSVALLLQMTVSGATGLPRRPEHSVKQHIRRKFEEVFKKRIPGFEKGGLAATTFLVPTECFVPFLFQREETMEGKISDIIGSLIFSLYLKSPKSSGTRRHLLVGVHIHHAVVSSDFKKRKFVHRFDSTKISDETAVDLMEM